MAFNDVPPIALRRALEFFVVLCRDPAITASLRTIYGSEAGVHVVWPRATIHIFAEADEGDAPELIYSLQYFPGERPSVSENFSTPQDVLLALVKTGLD